ncbi:MAG: FAD binding domain-containing protein [Acidobacteriota bacterium]
MSLTKLREYRSPEDRNEVVKLLEKYGESALIIAGGTFIHALAARGLLAEIEALIDIQKLRLDFIQSGGKGLQIGAMTTFAQLAQAGEVQSMAPLGAVKDALQYPPPQIKNMATVGGSVASSCPLFDLPVVFMALDGVVKSMGPRGEREIALGEFFLDYFENALEENEFLTELLLPPLPPGSSSAFIKLETNANDLAILNVGVRVTVEESGMCKDARVVVGGGVGKAPVRAVSSEKLLQGEKLTDELVKEAGQAARSDIRPVSDQRASSQYRSVVAKVLVERALRRAVPTLA